MSCPTKLVADIINSCKTVKGIKPFAYWAYRKDLNFTYSANEITAVDLVVLGTIQAIKFGLNAGFEEVAYEDNGNGFKHKFSGVINASTLTLDEMDDIVVFVQTNSGQWLAYGVTQGLWKVSQAKMANENLATIAVEFASLEGREESYSEYVVTADLSALPVITTFDTISGGTLPTPRAYFLHIDSNKTGYIRFADSSIVTTTGGDATGTYAGVSGAITYYVPKTTTVSDISNTDIQGHINFNGDGYLYAKTCPLLQSIIAPNANTVWVTTAITSVLTSIIAPKATTVLASGCALTKKSCGDILYAAYIDDRADVEYDFSGGTSAVDTAISGYLTDTYGVDLFTVETALELNGGDITYNT